MCCQTAFKLCANLALTGIFKQDITGRQGYILKRGNSCIYACVARLPSNFMQT